MKKLANPVEHQALASSGERILEAAEDLFSRRGFDAVSINDVAEKAGVSKAAVFYHFSSKSELYFAVLKAASQQFGSTLDALDKVEGEISHRLGHYALAHLACVLENEQISRLVQRDLLENTHRHSRELAEKIFGNNFARLVNIIRASQDSRELRSDIDPAMVAVLLIAANAFFFESREVLRYFSEVTFAAEPQRYSEMLVDIMLHGILPRQAKDHTDITG